MGSAIFTRNLGLERQGLAGSGGSTVGGPTLLLVRIVPIFPVLRDPGLQLLPRSPEVLLEEGLQLQTGDAVVVGAGQLLEGLKDLVWGGDTGAIGEIPDGRVWPLSSLVGNSGADVVPGVLPGAEDSDMSTNCLSSW